LNIKIDAEYDDSYFNGYLYLFFDIDEDDAPELCITNDHGFHYIYKYIPNTNQFVLWCFEMETSYYRLSGSRKIRWSRFGSSNAFYELDENGNIECSVSFFNYRQTEGQDMTFMVSFPKYWRSNEDDEREKEERVQNQGCFDESTKDFYYRVTKEQYEELTKDYFAAEIVSEDNREEVVYTYEELFGELDPSIDTAYQSQ